MGTPPNRLAQLSRRERQIMDVIYARGFATAKEVQDAIDDPPSYSSVRSALRLLEEKGLLRHRREGLKYVFAPTLSGEKAGISALRRIAHTFFENSAANLVAALLDHKDTRLPRAELARLEKMIRDAKQKADQ